MRNGLFAFLAICAVFLGSFIKETYLSIAIEEITQRAADDLGIPRASMIAAATPYVLSIAIITAASFAAFKLGEHKRESLQPTPDIDPRLAFERILNNSRWLKKNTENDPETKKTLVQNYLVDRT